MSSILRKNNLNDPYNYLPDNKTIGTFGFYKRKYGEKFPDWKYKMWEAYARLEGEEREKQLQEVNRELTEYNILLLAEYEERQQHFSDAYSKEQIDKCYDECLETQRKILECNSINERELDIVPNNIQ